jgi:Flp pilus assembly protein TadG
MSLRSVLVDGRRRSRSRGQSLVEFALILPLFLLILAGILDFGFLLNARMTLISGTREGARITVSMAANTSSIVSTATNTVRANVPGLTSTSPTLQVVVTCVDGTPTNGLACTTSGPSTIKPGDSIRVRTTYSYRSFFASLFGATIPLSQQVQVVLEPASS